MSVKLCNCQDQVSFCPYWEMKEVFLILFSLRWEKPLNVCKFSSVKPEILPCHLAGRRSPTDSSKKGKEDEKQALVPLGFGGCSPSLVGVKRNTYLYWLDRWGDFWWGLSVPAQLLHFCVRLHRLVEGRQHDAVFFKSNVGLEQVTGSSDEDENIPYFTWH